MNILTLSIGRHILREGSGDRRRMELYASHLDQLHVVVLTRHEHGVTETVQSGHLSVYPTNSTSRFMMLIDAFSIGRTILRQRAAKDFVVSAQDPFEIGCVSFLIAKMSGARFHVQLHGDYFDSLWQGASVPRAVRLLVARFLLARACGIRVVSERIKRSLVRRHIAESKIAILPIRPQLEAFSAVSPVSREGTPLTFLTVSRLAPEKNIPLMLRAFARLLNGNPAMQLRIVGSGGEEQRIRSLILELAIVPSVTMIPWTDDVPREMAKADVFLLASDHEAYGLVLVEALAAGLPVVTTDVGCVGEVVQQDIHGIVVPPRAEAQYFEALRTIAADPDRRRKMGIAGTATGQKLLAVSEAAYAEAWVAAHTCKTDRV